MIIYSHLFIVPPIIKLRYVVDLFKADNSKVQHGFRTMAEAVAFQNDRLIACGTAWRVA